MKMIFSSLSAMILLSVALLFAVGCDYFSKNEYSGKTFRVRTELMKGNETEVSTWENAKNLTFDEENFIYQFYVNDKLVSLAPRGTVIIEEQ